MAVMIKNQKIIILPIVAELTQAISQDFKQRVMKILDTRETCRIVLSGGNTPKFFFDALVSDFSQEVFWSRLQFFFSDERYVPVNHVENNYRMVNEHLFSRVPIRKENIFRIPTEFQDPHQAAKEYEKTLRTIFHVKNNEMPTFDIVYLGLGENAHTASLFPDSEPVKNFLEKKYTGLVSAVWISQLNMFRITLTAEALNHSDCIVFLVSGRNKSSAVHAVLEGPFDPQQYPAQLIHCQFGETCWYLDQAAAEELNQ